MSDLTALIARADKFQVFVNESVSAKELVRDLRDALTAAEARIKDLHDACTQKQEIIDSHAVVLGTQRAWTDAWEKKAKALAAQLSVQEERTGEWHRACVEAEQQLAALTAQEQKPPTES